MYPASHKHITPKHLCKLFTNIICFPPKYLFLQYNILFLHTYPCSDYMVMLRHSRHFVVWFNTAKAKWLQIYMYMEPKPDQMCFCCLTVSTHRKDWTPANSGVTLMHFVRPLFSPPTNCNCIIHSFKIKKKTFFFFSSPCVREPCLQ